MRKHDVRKWLHAVLDLLPVILIPVFMIYSHRHTLTERTEVEINYKYESNEVNTLDDLVEGNIYYSDLLAMGDDDYGYSVIIFTYGEILGLEDLSDASFEVNYSEEYNSNNYNYLKIIYNADYVYLYFTNEFSNVDVILEYGAYLEFTNCNFIVDYGLNRYKNVLNANGVSVSYTDYNVIESVSVNDTNKDIMTVFMDDFNGAIDKYFNMGNVFNLNGVYQWFNTNIFSGNAPTVIYSIWNIALYELVMDLLFLLYGLFMWFIDMIQKLMEKPLNSVK